GEGIGGAQVNYSVEPPQAPPLRESFITAPNGEPPSFLEFQSNADFEPGIYPISFNATWFDPDINFTEHERVSTSVAFTKAGQVQASWDTQDVLFPGVNYTAHIILTREGSFTSADQINLTVLTNGGQVFQEFEFDTENFTQTSPGIYHVTKEIPVDAPLGLYWSKLHVKQGNSETVEFQSFRLADEDVATGPFDIRLDLVQDKVRQGEDIGFNITMKNQGNESGDAKVTYWVTEHDSHHPPQPPHLRRPAAWDLHRPRRGHTALQIL
ncbi:MAG: hypothetical protein SVU32_05675, partial [Candidatus Nanohaloarchaea archaeon]|nr:hypothetical protein [Candidatus Nanohaloarchaea archaeon]